MNPQLFRGIFIVFSYITNLSPAFCVQTLPEENILRSVFSTQQSCVFPACVKIILIWWHLLLLRASVAVRRQMPLFFFLCFIWDMLYFVPTGLQWRDQTGATERALPVERLWWVEQREECAREECTTSKHNIHEVEYKLQLCKRALKEVEYYIIRAIRTSWS